MNSRFPNLNSLWAEAAVEELVRCGVRLFCLCPGSRSTPLTAAAARHEAARKIVHFDERGAAFCALGYARATEKPAAVVVTSGTAAANLYPAVIEAAMDGVPLLVLTADRPPELRASGANQTIDQTKLYADYPRWFFDLPCPSRETPPEFVLTTIDQAVYRAQHGPAGPVHLNWMFREPLAPVGAEEDFGDYLRSVGCWRTGESPWTIYRSPVKVCEPARMEAATGLLNRARRGVIVVGRLRREAERVAIAKVAEALGWPVIADIGSGLRLGAAGHVIAPAEYMLAAESFADALAPDTVLHFGPIVTSKRVAQWLKRSQPAAYIHAAAAPERHDPHHQVTHRFEADIDMFCSFLLPFLREKAKETGLAAWRAGADKAEAAIARVLAEDATLSEPLTARLVAENISAAGALFVASSMPIRDLDALAAGDGPAAPVAANRGASGIDGTVASAAGFGLGWERPVTLLTGDLALLHDLNSLALVRRLAQPMTIVVLNNNGGGIFHFLPIAERADLFEPYWGTPHGITFKQAAQMFGLSYAHPTSAEEFARIYREAQAGPGGGTLIEVRTDRRRNRQLHARLTEAVVRALEG